MNTISITTSQNIELEYDLASLGERIAAYLLDFAILILYVILFMTIIGLSAIASFIDKNMWLALFLSFPVVFYHLLCESFLNGQSFGKRIMKIKVISIKGDEPSLSQFIIRWIFRMVDFTFFSPVLALISIAISKNKQRIGDLVAGTTLVRTVARTQFEDTIFSQEIPENYEFHYPEVIELKDNDMQLVKEILNNIQKSGNTMLAVHA
ncbi:MAG: RDD family protein, partial [Chitinophagaceae bacterium]